MHNTYHDRRCITVVYAIPTRPMHRRGRYCNPILDGMCSWQIIQSTKADQILQTLAWCMCAIVGVERNEGLGVYKGNRKVDAQHLAKLVIINNNLWAVAVNVTKASIPPTLQQSQHPLCLLFPPGTTDTGSLLECLRRHFSLHPSGKTVETTTPWALHERPTILALRRRNQHWHGFHSLAPSTARHHAATPAQEAEILPHPHVPPGLLRLRGQRSKDHSGGLPRG
jgi:hypothetical protein